MYNLHWMLKKTNTWAPSFLRDLLGSGWMPFLFWNMYCLNKNQWQLYINCLLCCQIPAEVFSQDCGAVGTWKPREHVWWFPMRCVCMQRTFLVRYPTPQYLMFVDGGHDGYGWLNWIPWKNPLVSLKKPNTMHVYGTSTYSFTTKNQLNVGNYISYEDVMG